MSAAARRLARAVVGPLPEPLADALRRGLAPGAGTSVTARIRRKVLRWLCRGGIPRAVSGFHLVDNPELQFVATDSQVLEQLYWSGEDGWEPELLPWWRACCRNSTSVLELGTNIGYFAVQGGRAAAGVRYVAVEPHPGRGPAALHGEVADVGPQLEHRRRAPAEGAPPRQQLGLPALLARPVELLEHLRVDGDELEVRIVGEPEAGHRAGDPAPVERAQHRAAHRGIPGARREEPAQRVGEPDRHRRDDGPRDPSSERAHSGDA